MLNPDISLYPYQIEGVNFLKAKGSALLADDPGLGKTLISLATAEALDLDKILIVCPKILATQWKEEIKKFIHSDRITFVVTGDKIQREAIYDQIKKTSRCYVIIGYETLRVDIDLILLL